MKKAHKLLGVMLMLGTAQASADTPRTLANGGPACGNTMGKGRSKPQSLACKVVRAEARLASVQRALDTARAEATRYTIAYMTTPRTLPSGAPACGNVMGKGEAPVCTEQQAELEHQSRLASMNAALAQAREMSALVHRATRDVAALQLAMHDEGAQQFALSANLAERADKIPR